MNRAERRAFARSHHPSALNGPDCGCNHLGHMLGVMTCPDGHVSTFDAWVPTARFPGDELQAGKSCEAGCDKEATGTVRIVEVV